MKENAANLAGVSEHLLYREGPIWRRKTREKVLSQNTGSLLRSLDGKTVSSRIFSLNRTIALASQYLRRSLFLCVKLSELSAPWVHFFICVRYCSGFHSSNPRHNKQKCNSSLRHIRDFAHMTAKTRMKRRSFCSVFSAIYEWMTDWLTTWKWDIFSCVLHGGVTPCRLHGGLTPWQTIWRSESFLIVWMSGSLQLSFTHSNGLLPDYYRCDSVQDMGNRESLRNWRWSDPLQVIRRSYSL